MDIYHFQSGQRQEAHRARREESEESGNIVEGLLEIVNMITDNPGLKSDLQEYFENSKRQGKEDKRKINSKFSVVLLDFLHIAQCCYIRIVLSR